MCNTSRKRRPEKWRRKRLMDTVSDGCRHPSSFRNRRILHSLTSLREYGQRQKPGIYQTNSMWVRLLSLRASNATEELDLGSYDKNEPTATTQSPAETSPFRNILRFEKK